MATFFGEVLPVISRAVDDDDEEDSFEDIANAVQVRWTATAKADMQQASDKRLQCNALIIAIGTAASGFSQTYITHNKYEIIGGVFAGMKDDDVNTFHQMSPTDKSCYIYRNIDVPTALVCQCNVDVTPHQSYSFVNKLLPNICLDTAYVSILSSAFTSEYKGDKPVSEMNPPFLRGLITTKCIATPLCPYLEQPNVATGLPAQILTYCQIHSIKAVLYICYTDSIYLDSPTMKTFLPLLDSTPIKDIVQNNPKAGETLQRLVELHTKHNTLYL